MNIQIIEQQGKPEYAVIPFADYQAMVASLEDAEDLSDALAFKGRVLSGEEETFPHSFVEKLCEEGASAMREYRKYRGFSQQVVADKIGVQQAAIACFESGKREPSASQLQRMAEALGVDMEDLL